MEKQSISIAMCTYNGERYLREQLESLRAQSLLPGELVICDDGSTDDSRELIESFRAAAPFAVRLIVNEQRLGPARNFQNAIERCVGELIALADQDDVWCAGKLERLAQALEEHPEAAYAFSDGEMIDERGQPLGIGLWETIGFSPKHWDDFSGQRQFHQLFKANVITGCAMAFRANRKSLFLPIPEHWIHDYWIAMLGSIFGYGVAIPERLICYRKHASQQIGVKRDSVVRRGRESLSARKQDYWDRLAGIRELQERVRSYSMIQPCPGNYLAEIDQRAIHLARRAASQDASGFKRLSMVLDECFTGRYARFSGAWRSVLRDLCPPFLLH